MSARFGGLAIASGRYQLIRSLSTKLLATYLFIVIATLLIMGIAMWVLFPHFEIRNRTAELTERGLEIAALAETNSWLYTIPYYNYRILRVLDSAIGANIWLTDARGYIHTTSFNLGNQAKEIVNPVNLEQYADFRNGEVVVRREKSGDDLKLTVVVPVMASDGSVAGAVILESPLGGFWALLDKSRGITLGAGLIAICLATCVGIGFSRRLTYPLREIKHSVERLKKGDFTVRVKQISSDEIGMLAQGFNTLAAELGRTVSSLERQEQMRREFLTNISHDLRTPLTTLRGFLQAITEGVIDDMPQVRKSADVMLKETLRLIRLVNTLFELSRLQEGSLVLNPEPVQISGVIEDLAVSFMILAEEKGVSIELDIPENELPLILVDRNSFEQVITNLLDNAVKFTRRGDRIRISAEKATHADGRSGVLIKVTDTGPGIRSEDLPFVWERFYKGDKSRERSRAGDDSGTGLGLVIVKSLVEAHSGYVDVQSDERETTFMVWLPQCTGQPKLSAGQIGA